jgi:hypothetical protein
MVRLLLILRNFWMLKSEFENFSDEVDPKLLIRTDLHKGFQNLLVIE